MSLEEQQNLIIKLQRFKEAISFFSEDIPLEFISSSLRFQNVEELLEWLIKLNLDNFEVTDNAEKLIITEELIEEINDRLKVSNKSLIVKNSYSNVEQMEIPDYHGTYLLKEDRNAIDKLDDILKQPLPRIKGKISWTKFGFIAENYKIIGLLLTNKGLTRLPDEISQFKNLKILDISGNNFTEFPDVICKLKNLEALSIQFNHIFELPEEISKLKNLKEFFLDCNHLKMLPACIGTLINLIKLTVGNNKISGVSDSIGNLQNLEKLFLCTNRLKSIPKDIFLLKSLIDLNLGDNEITIIPKEINQLVKLRELYLLGNTIEQFESLVHITALEALDLSGNNLTSIPKNLKKLKNLKYLNLKFNSGIGEKAVEVGGTVVNVEQNKQKLIEFLNSAF
ncbi:MAG: Internalin-A precursor [Candidatus Heimdallarchaeota archaeon LC_3]|nr:MAG: Internalin-A precursor [Candidatus Heimdallarchaeota archaeon LC_3]